MILIILPVKNESKTIVATLTELALYLINEFPDYEILVIDDWSTDGTYDLVKSMGEKSGRIRVFKNHFDNGKGSAIKAGYVYSNFIYSLRGGDLVCFLDGDGQIDSCEIGTFVKLMDLYNSEVVIGNKRHLYSVTKYSKMRTIISKTYNFMVRFLFGINYRDTQCGLKIFKKDALDAVINKIQTKTWAFDIELILALQSMNLRIADGPVRVKDQTNRGSVSFKSIFNTFIDTIRIYKKMKKGFYNN